MDHADFVQVSLDVNNSTVLGNANICWAEGNKYAKKIELKSA